MTTAGSPTCRMDGRSSFRPRGASGATSLRSRGGIETSIVGYRRFLSQSGLELRLRRCPRFRGRRPRPR
eukprot:888662-Pyramimonas_sp.AAC.1